ncbi:GIY-YIG nuclease family protein, partial [Vibrio echinoideorum]|uniref:GIY-YIG nuclease family protein n=1 Tax=Vibrio echinoideorum TaxID=2100116 RepID=UPI003C753C68
FDDDATTVEKELHRRFSKYRLYTENHRKDFFNVSPEQVEEAIEELGIETDWYFDVEAK